MRDSRRLRLRAGRHLRPRGASPRCFATHGPARWCTSRPRATSTARSVGPAEFVRTNVVGTFTLLEAARAYWTRPARRRKAAFRFLHVSTDEVYGSLGPSDRPFTETHRLRAQQPVLAPARPARDHLVRAYHHTYGLPALTTNCSNNYGPYQFPEKLIPLMIANALEGKPLPVYGDGLQRARLALRRRPLRGDPRGAGARARRRDLQHRRQQRDGATSTSCARSARMLDELQPERRTGRYARADHLREGPARARPALRHRRPQDRSASSAGGRRRPSRRASRKTVAVVPRPTRSGSSACATGVTASGSSSNYASRGMTAVARREGHHPRRRLRHAAVSGDAGGLEAAAADLRQADDLLPADRR